MATVTIGEGGQVTLPPEVLEEVGAAPGDAATVVATARGTIELAPAGDETARASRDTEDEYSVNYDELPVLSAAELFARYRIPGPVDLAQDRAAWQAAAASDALGE